MKILLTGGAGFIGSAVVKQLLIKKHEITIIDNFSSGKEENISNLNVKLIKKDVSRPLNIKQKFDAIIHLASITDTTFSDDSEMLRQNIEGFKNVLMLAKSCNAKLVYASSAGVYGNGPVPMKESQKLQPLNAYAKSKVEMDKIAHGYFEKMHIVGLRYFNVFGPGEKFKGKSSSMIYQLSMQMKNKIPKIFYDGKQKRDFIYVNDVADATIKALDAKKSGVYNVGTGNATTFNELIKLLNKILGYSYDPEYIENPYVKFYQNNTLADINESKNNLGFIAQYSTEKGIREYAAELK